MRRKRWGNAALRVLLALVSLLCALALAAMFYGTMVYQLLDENGRPLALEEAQPAGLLALGEGEMTDEQTYTEAVGGVDCTVVARAYALEGGGAARAITATPAAYLERLQQEGWQPQLVTGFTLAGMDAVCERREGEMLLAARAGETVYLLATDGEEQTLYALGTTARIE